MSGLDNCPCCSETAIYFPESYQTWSVNDISLISVVKESFNDWTCKDMDVFYSSQLNDYYVMFDWNLDFSKYWDYAIGIYFNQLYNYLGKYNGTYIVLHPTLYNSAQLKNVILHEIGHSLGMGHMHTSLESVMAVYRKDILNKPTANDFYIYANLAKVNKQLGNKAVKTSDNAFDPF